MLGFLYNPVLIAGFTGWVLAQVIKVPLNYLTNREWDWALLLRAGGMPSFSIVSERLE